MIQPSPSADTKSQLEQLDDDILLHIFTFLGIPEILSLRQVCKRTFTISQSRFVWIFACKAHILQKGLPFSQVALEEMSSSEVESRTRHAYCLSRNWLSSTCRPRRVQTFDLASRTPTDLRFLPGHDGRWLITVSKGIWSIITAWSVGDSAQKISEWGLKGALFHGFAINSDPQSLGSLAVSVLQEGWQRTEILSLRSDGSGSTFNFESIATIPTSERPIAMQGDIIALCDSRNETLIWNWRENTRATLRNLPDERGISQEDRPLQVVFAHESILVFRARSLHLFPKPTLRSIDDPSSIYQPIASHSFGWIDGATVKAITPPHSLPLDRAQEFEPLSILIRAESDDPWSSDVRSIDLYTLEPNPDFSSPPTVESEGAFSNIPYLFPPLLSTRVPAIGGPLRCTDLILGRCGTAVWLHPQDRAVGGLISPDVHLQQIPAPVTPESLVAAIFLGTLSCGTDGNAVARNLYTNDANNWTSLDYDEDTGRIAVGSSYGQISIISM